MICVFLNKIYILSDWLTNKLIDWNYSLRYSKFEVIVALVMVYIIVRMAEFAKLRGILAEPKPDLVHFRQQLQKVEVKKEDLDLLLRKAVEAKHAQFPLFCSALVGYISLYSGKAPISIFRTPRVCIVSVRSHNQPYVGLRKRHCHDGRSPSIISRHQPSQDWYSPTSRRFLCSRKQKQRGQWEYSATIVTERASYGI